MVQRVNVNGVIHQFPDEATPQMIAEALGVQPPDDVAQTNTSTPQKSKAQELGQMSIDALKGALSGGITGLGKGGEFIAKALTGGYAPSGDIEGLANKLVPTNDSTATNIGKGVGSYAPYALMGGASLLPDLTGGTITKIIGNILAKPGQLAAGALSGAANTGDNESNLFGFLPSGKTGGAIESALLNALTGGAAKGLEALRPSNVLRGTLSPEQLNRNLNVTSGTETGLGDVIGSPYLKRLLENSLQRVPLTGASESLRRTGNEIVSRGQNILSGLLGDEDPENVPEAVSESLKNIFDARKQNKANLYTKSNKTADDIGLKLELPNFARNANKYSDAIEGTTFLKNEPDVAAIYKRLQNYRNPVTTKTDTGVLVDAQGNPLVTNTETTYPRLEEANSLAGRLSEKARQVSASPLQQDREMAGIYSTLSKSLKSDIKNAIDKSGNKDLKSQFDEAETNYAKNYSPFLDKDIYKYVAGTNVDNQTLIDKFMKTGRGQDRSNLANKLLTKLPDREKSLVAYHYLSKALDNDGNVSPNILATQINKLGPKQFKALVPNEELRNNLTNYSKLTGMNQESLSTMFNPKTGQRNLDSLITGIGAGATSSGHARALLTALLGGRLMSKALTSEEIRNSLVKKMINNKPLFTGGNKMQGYSTAVQALKNALAGDNSQ